MLPDLINMVATEKSTTILVLLAGDIALCYGLLMSWRWHRKDRSEDRDRWIEATEKHTQQLSALTEAITQLRIMVSQCNNRRSRG